MSSGLAEEEKIRIIAEYRTEVAHAIELLRVRLNPSDAEKASSPAMVLTGLVTGAFDYAHNNGISPEQFIAALRRAADRLEAEWVTRSGTFAKGAGR